MPAPAAPPGRARLGHWGSWTVGECGQGPGKHAQTQPLAPAVSPVLGGVDGVGRKEGSDSGSSLGRLGGGLGALECPYPAIGESPVPQGLLSSPLEEPDRSEEEVCWGVCGILGCRARSGGCDVGAHPKKPRLTRSGSGPRH